MVKCYHCTGLGALLGCVTGKPVVKFFEPKCHLAQTSSSIPLGIKAGQVLQPRFLLPFSPFVPGNFL